MRENFRQAVKYTLQAWAKEALVEAKIKDWPGDAASDTSYVTEMVSAAATCCRNGENLLYGAGVAVSNAENLTNEEIDRYLNREIGADGDGND